MIHGFGGVLQELAGVNKPSDVTQEVLLTAPLASIFYNDKHVITAVGR